MSLLFFESLLIFWHAEMSHTNPCPFPAPGLKSAITLRSTGPFQWRMVFRNQDLGATCAGRYWGVFYKLLYVYMYSHI